jgi:hypothetical protein
VRAKKTFAGLIERVEQIDLDVVRLLESELRLALEHGSERLPLQTLHHVERQVKVIRRRARGVDLYDVGVLELGQRASLAGQARCEIGALG